MTKYQIETLTLLLRQFEEYEVESEVEEYTDVDILWSISRGLAGAVQSILDGASK